MAYSSDPSLTSASPQTETELDQPELIDEDEGAQSPAPDPDGYIRERHRLILSLSLLVFVMAPLLVVVGEQERIAFRWWPGFELPESCSAKRFLKAGCPGCGLTRSTVYLFQGRFQDAWELHRLGPLMLLTILLQVPYRLWALYGPSPYPLGKRGPRLFAWLLTCLLLGNWLWKVAETW